MNLYYPPLVADDTLDGGFLANSNHGKKDAGNTNPEPYTFPTVHPTPTYLTLYPPVLPQESQDRARRGSEKSIKKTQSFLEQYYVKSTHVVPGAYPRFAPCIALPNLEVDEPDIETKHGSSQAKGENESVSGSSSTRAKEKGIRQDRAGREARYILGLHTSYKRASAKGETFSQDGEKVEDSRNRVLWNVFHRYVRRDRKSEKRRGKSRHVTLFLTHANGLSKEVCLLV